MKTTISSDRLLFVGGLHKSGTSIFHRCIGDHSQISSFSDTGVPRDEGQLLQSVFPPAHESGGMGRFGFHDASHLTEDSPLVGSSNAKRLLREWSEYWDTEKKMLVEKSPPTLIRMRFLQALFPEAGFVILLRHPLAVSYSTSKWTDIPLHLLVAHWVRCHRIFEEDRPEIRRIMVVRYEDFVRRPRETLSSIYEFAGLAREPAGQKVRREVNRKHLRRWTYNKLLPRASAYRRRIIERYEEDVRRFDYGYTLDREVWL